MSAAQFRANKGGAPGQHSRSRSVDAPDASCSDIGTAPCATAGKREKRPFAPHARVGFRGFLRRPWRPILGSQWPLSLVRGGGAATSVDGGPRCSSRRRYPCLQAAPGWGGGSDFRAGPRAPQGVWGAFRTRQFSESEQAWISEQDAPRKSEQGALCIFSVQVPLENEQTPRRGPEKVSKHRSRPVLTFLFCFLFAPSGQVQRGSAGQLLDRAHELVVATGACRSRSS